MLSDKHKTTCTLDWKLLNKGLQVNVDWHSLKCHEVHVILNGSSEVPQFASQILIEKFTFQTNTGTELGIKGAAPRPSWVGHLLWDELSKDISLMQI